MIKQFFRRLVRWTAEVQAEVTQKTQSELLLDELRKDARSDTVEFIKNDIPDAVWFPNKFDMMDYALAKLPGGLVLEFGVWTGRTINFIASRTDRAVHGFDSFEGLPEQWKGYYHVDFSTKNKLPTVKDNVQLHVGWFDATLPTFLNEYLDPVAFLHIDCDIYSSAKTIFNLLQGRIIEGTYIEFDDYFGFPGWRKHSHKAFIEFLAEMNMRAEYLGFAGDQVLVRIVNSPAFQPWRGE